MNKKIKYLIEFRNLFILKRKIYQTLKIPTNLIRSTSAKQQKNAFLRRALGEKFYGKRK